MTLFCFIPMLWIGYGQSIQTDWHTSADLSGPVVSVETCHTGISAHVRAGAEWVAYGLHYGHAWPLTKHLSLNAQIGGGGHYSNTIHPHSSIRQVTRFSFQANVSLIYKRVGLSCGYDHGSNGRGIDPSNAGQDILSCSLGYQLF